MSTPCQKEEVIEMIREDLSEIKGDVKSLLAYKWQIMGGSAVVGVLLTALVGWLLK